MSRPYSSHLTIDIHSHILPSDIPDWKEQFGYGGFIRLEKRPDDDDYDMKRDDGTFFRTVRCNCIDPSVRLREYEACGAHVQAVSTVPVMFSYWAQPRDGLRVAEFINDRMKELAREFPNEMAPMGTLPLQDTECALSELERLAKTLQLPCVQIGSHVNDMTLDDPSLLPVFQRAAELGVSIFIHPWDMMGGQLLEKHWGKWLIGMPAETCLAASSLIFGGVLEECPDLQVCLAHGGGSFPGTIGRLEHGLRCRPDLFPPNARSPRDYLDRIYVDSLTHDVGALKNLIQMFGDERVMLGTDYPFPLGELDIGKTVHDAELPETSRARVLGGNAARFLKLDAARLCEVHNVSTV